MLLIGARELAASPAPVLFRPLLPMLLRTNTLFVAVKPTSASFFSNLHALSPWGAPEQGWKARDRYRAGIALKKWKNPPVTWKLADTQLAIRFGQRFFAVGDLKKMKPKTCQKDKRWALQTIGSYAQTSPQSPFSWAVLLLRRSGPVPGILAAARARGDYG